MTAPILALLVAAAPVQMPTTRVLIVGDSLTDAGIVPDRLSRRLPFAVFVGDKAGTWGGKHCGYSGYSAGTFENSESSILRYGGALDMGHYFSVYGTPTILVISLGINSLLECEDEAAVEARIVLELASMDAIIASARAASPGIKVIITAPGESYTGWAGYAAWEALRDNVVAGYSAHYSGRTDEGIWFLAYYILGSWDYNAGNTVHPHTLGYERMYRQLAPVIYAAAVSEWTP